MINDISRKKKEEGAKLVQKKRELTVTPSAVGVKRAKVDQRSAMEKTDKEKDTALFKRAEEVNFESSHSDLQMPVFAPNSTSPEVGRFSSSPTDAPSSHTSSATAPSSTTNVLDLAQLFADSPLLTEEHRKIITEFNQALKTEGLMNDEGSGPDSARKFKLREDRHVDENTGEIIKETMFLTLRYDARTWQKTKKSKRINKLES